MIIVVQLILQRCKDQFWITSNCYNHTLALQQKQNLPFLKFIKSKFLQKGYTKEFIEAMWSEWRGNYQYQFLTMFDSF